MTDRPSSPSDENDIESLDEGVRMVLERFSLPCAAIEFGGTPARPTDSYLAGSPYLPDGAEWPEDDHGPQLFVGQINWAQVPPLEPGYPTAGLLQWFVSADDTWGFDWGAADRGATGFTVRWFDDTTAPSYRAPDSPPPYPADTDHPIEVSEPTLLRFRQGVSVPNWTDLTPGIRDLELWPAWAEQKGHDRSDAEWLFDEVREDPAFHPASTVLGSKIGGFAITTQGEPRGTGAFPHLYQEGGGLLVELNAEDLGGGWGDVGIAHLFGQPDALANGDLSLVRYHWDCT